MSTLHLLNSSPFVNKQVTNALLFAHTEDAILLMGDATYALQHNSIPYQTLQKSQSAIFALKEDVEARAIITSLEDVTLVDYPTFVTLCTQYTQVVSWL